jgi:hypothetical protein
MAEKSNPGRQTDGKSLVWFGEMERKLPLLAVLPLNYFMLPAVRFVYQTAFSHQTLVCGSCGYVNYMYIVYSSLPARYLCQLRVHASSVFMSGVCPCQRCVHARSVSMLALCPCQLCVHESSVSTSDLCRPCQFCVHDSSV